MGRHGYPGPVKPPVPQRDRVRRRRPSYEKLERHVSSLRRDAPDRLHDSKNLSPRPRRTRREQSLDPPGLDGDEVESDGSPGQGRARTSPSPLDGLGGRVPSDGIVDSSSSLTRSGHLILGIENAEEDMSLRRTRRTANCRGLKIK